MRRILFSVCIIVGMAACKSKEQPLPINDMKVIMWDLMKADEWFTVRSSKDSTLLKKNEHIRLYEQVFLIHGVTRTKFYTSYAHYEAHPGEMKTLLDSVNLYSERERQKMFEHNYGQKKQ